ncbi:glutathione S-transferase [Aaosphaeria arxii CBS 175.79]|uniref:Glutathione S-transferase n=1 Tax=Aaosphaeria arxii CBS 175.79 TaxID=1450172 RepID=A0A6A5XVD9_9PLEO|nr:glutathione S-transferase [Aaosphaeria arxii CBS 175.79]KAF2016787.1 glutathione S-transferase [Aaosphaeria arxii CBS 175.79]
MSSETLTLISATPSPFARMNRVALELKGIPFTLQNEIPWQSETQTPKYNPLEKLPILLFPDGRPPVYDSAHIQEYIIQKYSDRKPLLLTGDIDLDLHARQIQVLSEGILDAAVLQFWETQRGEHKSNEWMARQNRKIDGGMKALEQLTRERGYQGKEYLVGDELTIADIAAVCAIGHIDFVKIREGWQEQETSLARWWTNLESREYFRHTRPVMFEFRELVV